LNLRQIIYF